MVKELARVERLVEPAPGPVLGQRPCLGILRLLELLLPGCLGLGLRLRLRLKRGLLGCNRDAVHGCLRWSGGVMGDDRR